MAARVQATRPRTPCEYRQITRPFPPPAAPTLSFTPQCRQQGHGVLQRQTGARKRLFQCRQLGVDGGVGLPAERPLHLLDHGEHGEPGDDAASGLSSTSMAGCTHLAGLLRV